MFETSDIKINEHGIDLIKNFQIYKHVDYAEILQIEIRKGHYVKNWILSFTIGITIFLISAFLIFIFFNVNGFESIPLDLRRRYVMFNLITPFILLIAGLILVFQSLRYSPRIIIRTKNGKCFNTILDEIKNRGDLAKLLTFLEQRVELINLIERK